MLEQFLLQLVLAASAKPDADKLRAKAKASHQTLPWYRSNFDAWRLRVRQYMHDNYDPIVAEETPEEP